MMKSFALALAAGAAQAAEHYQYKNYTPASTPKQYGHSCAAPYYCSPNNYH